MSNSVPSEVSIKALRSNTAFSLRTSSPIDSFVLRSRCGYCSSTASELAVSGAVAGRATGLAKRASVAASAVDAWPSGPAGDSIDASSGPCRKLKYAKPTMTIVNKTAESVCLFFILCYSSSNTW